MGDKSKIEWTEATWNPVLGCSKVSPGCQNCYAVQQSFRNEAMHSKDYTGLTVKHPNGLRDWSGKVVCLPERLEIPLKWKKPRRIFVNSMSDLFHKDVPFEFVDQVFAVMEQAEQHIFQVLTKRPERMLEYLSHSQRHYCIQDAAQEFALFSGTPHLWMVDIHKNRDPLPWPLPNVWLGTSVENQATADERIPQLLQCPAAVRWLSCEPLLGPVQLKQNDHSDSGHGAGWFGDLGNAAHQRGIDWIVCGGESGLNARPMHPDWARGLRDQCEAANVPFFFKQWGEWGFVDDHPLCPIDPRDNALSVGQRAIKNDCVRVGKARAGRQLDGVEHNEYPHT